MKEGWKTTTIKEIFDVKSGTTPSTSEKKYWDNGNIYWVTPADLSGINEHLYIERCNKKITETALKETGLIIVPKDTIIISTRAPVGTLALSKCDLTFNQGCRGLINRDESCYDTKFYYYYLLGKTIDLQNQSGGSTFKELSKARLESFPVPLPPLPEQKRIAEILTAADSAIEEADRAVKESERAKQGLMQKLILDEKDGAKEGWKTTTIKEIFDVKSGTTPSTSEKKYWDDGNIYWVTPADLSWINEHLYIEHSNKKITETALKETGLIIVPKDTIIISTRAPVGTLALSKCDLTFNQGCRGLINRDESCYDTKFYYYYLLGKTIDLQNQSGGSTFKELSKARLESFPVPLPTITEQKHISEILSVADEKIELCKQRKALLEKTKQGLMQKLLGA